MFRLRSRQRCTAWIASFAILLAALAPVVSQLMAARAGDEARWLEICTVAGTERVAVAGDHGDGGGKPAQAMGEHCPYCFTHAGSFGLPPADVPVFAVAGGADVLPPLYFAAPRPLFAWAAAQPRAPPLSA
ncbi:DUF2946 domain-containing protein [Azoarcus olearius]|uniref:Conserved hypothetical secreted protein n=1 Tax=Azoarcus sp. (strain BH72) TaxID=418699 RepID=A1K7G9_AZOSB|nr:DUF2946 domain-containing protein [Azoarcus olearius]CAL94774.1 conserved hypothetical secreted protein [Azoarcus olearius]